MIIHVNNSTKTIFTPRPAERRLTNEARNLGPTAWSGLSHTSWGVIDKYGAKVGYTSM
jgi:hypothetical protein